MVSHGPQGAPRQGDRPGATFYALLGLGPDAPEAAIRTAITTQRRTWRRRTTAPDINARQEAERRMQALEDAERTLLDAERRRAYDAHLRTVKGPPPGQPAGLPPGGPAGARPSGPPGARPPGPVRSASGGGPTAPAGGAPGGPPAGPPAEQEDRRWLVRAVEQLDKGQAEVAAFTARRAVDEDPENSYAWSVLAEAAARSSDPQIAQDAISRALVLDPESAALHAQRGWILEHAGEHERGVGAYRSAAKLAPKRPDYRVRAVKALLRADLVDDAVTEAEAAYQAFPEDGDVRSALGAALAERAVAAQHELPDGRLVISSLSQASYVLALANRGLSVHPPDPGVRVDLERQREYARKAGRRRFSMAAFRRNYRWPVGFGLLAVAGVCCGPGFAQGFSDGFRLMYYVGLMVVLLGLAGAVLLTCFEPIHKRNATLIENTVPRRSARGPGATSKQPR